MAIKVGPQEVVANTGYWVGNPYGLKGAEGTKGEPGGIGAKGGPGEDGAGGDKGGPGEDGVDGAKGLVGEKGGPGVGTDGTDGADGADGTDGTNGINGDDGVDGTDGTDGTNGDDGDDGVDGEKGQPGESGVLSDHTADIANDFKWWEAPLSDGTTDLKIKILRSHTGHSNDDCDAFGNCGWYCQMHGITNGRSRIVNTSMTIQGRYNVSGSGYEDFNLGGQILAAKYDGTNGTDTGTVTLWDDTKVCHYRGGNTLSIQDDKPFIWTIWYADSDIIYDYSPCWDTGSGSGGCN